MSDKSRKNKQPLPPFAKWAPVLAVAWLVPGGGHILLRRHARGAILAGVVTLSFV
jgi:hypothetical protein